MRALFIVSVLVLFSGCVSSPAEANTQDLSVCEGMPEQGIKDVCIKNVAKADGRPVVCGMIQDQSQRDLCYRDVAKALPDTSVCELVEGVSVRKYCYYSASKASGDPAVCTGVGGDDGAWCTIGAAEARDDQMICDTIENEFLKQECRKKTNTM